MNGTLYFYSIFLFRPIILTGLFYTSKCDLNSSYLLYQNVYSNQIQNILRVGILFLVTHFPTLPLPLCY